MFLHRCKHQADVRGEKIIHLVTLEKTEIHLSLVIYQVFLNKFKNKIEVLMLFTVPRQLLERHILHEMIIIVMWLRYLFLEGFVVN